ncbi:alpha/beta hydrolase [Streptomyces sp. NPDC093085]|uniref:alpha/beta hydrolase n=1 Tax=Streptomyces sp. NPDC093085 TaxID=3155068 RepID=UPI00343DC81F
MSTHTDTDTDTTVHTDDFHGPSGLRTRGTVLVVPGRGESRAAYTRLGRRLAADAYRVRVLDAPRIDGDDLAGSLARFGGGLAAALDGAADPAGGSGGGAAGPVVVVGADTGAAAVAALLAAGTGSGTGAATGSGSGSVAGRVDGVVLAGLPGRGAGPGGGWDAELDVRTACPAHRGVLGAGPDALRGALDTAVPGALLDAAYGAELAVPALFLVGEADPLADRDALARTVAAQAAARLAVVREAHHDVLNDLQHRSVAAEVVSFLEALRGSLVPSVVVESSTW